VLARTSLLLPPILPHPLRPGLLLPIPGAPSLPALQYAGSPSAGTRGERVAVPVPPRTCRQLCPGVPAVPRAVARDGRTLPAQFVYPISDAAARGLVTRLPAPRAARGGCHPRKGSGSPGTGSSLPLVPKAALGGERLSMHGGLCGR